MGQLFKGMFKGILFGAIAAVGIFALDIVAILCCAAVRILTCNCDDPTGFGIFGHWQFFTVLIICVIGGAVIGSIYGAIKGVQQTNREREERFTVNHNTVKKELDEAQGLLSQVEKNESNAVPKAEAFAADYRKNAMDRRSGCQKLLEETKLLVRHRH